MTRTTLVLAIILPIALSSFIPLDPYRQGNKRRLQVLDVTVYNNQGQCDPHVEEWNVWDGGFVGKIQVDEDKSKDWTVEIELDKSVDSFEVFGGQTDKSSGDKFVVTSGDCESSQFVVMGKFAKNAVGPMLKTIKVNNEAIIFCNKEDEPSPVETQPDGPNETEETEDEQGEEEAAETVVSPAVVPGSRNHVDLPEKIIGLYVLLADDDEDGFESEAEWEPKLYSWQQNAANVLFFTFIHPTTMDVPPSFKKLSDTRGTNTEGAVPADTTIIFAIGGYAYSIDPNPWDWLTSKEKAEAMAEKVAKWYDDYNCDGIDLDLEEGAGAKKEAGPNMIHFVRKLRQLQPKMIISQPTYGYPQVQAEIDVINAGWDENGKSTNLIDTVGLMVYEGDQALNYVKNYANGAGQWEGFPVKVNVPTDAILLGAKGSIRPDVAIRLAKESVNQNLRGIMVWYTSVKNGFKYSPVWDWTEDSSLGLLEARRVFDEHLAHQSG
ncbi:uncharacterized protein LOC131885858 [Tigriopus californicus]|nr:uncharacterized protein LOC131885858 [Tigriopus californicus]|eukprot:TCALIF_04675-PA protein Name:"Protein of unknown function" AED:0.00 eAED:0.00 QI:91/1/1/1/1/1/4/85/491